MAKEEHTRINNTNHTSAFYSYFPERAVGFWNRDEDWAGKTTRARPYFGLGQAALTQPTAYEESMPAFHTVINATVQKSRMHCLYCLATVNNIV